MESTKKENLSKFDNENEIKIGDTFSINYQNILGSGAFGTIYLGFNHKTNEEVAIKMESQKTKNPQLINEIGIPNLFHTATIGEYSIMIMNNLDKNLEELMNKCLDKKFSLKTVLMIADQLITRLEYLHSKFIIHRDIKPENFLIGKNENNFIIYLIDYGLANKFINPKTGHHILFSEGKSLIGTARFASINTHLGFEQSRRDDMESLGYLLVYFYSGCLPWQGIKAKTKFEKYNKILEIKLNTVSKEICKYLPGNDFYIKLDEFSTYFDYVRGLDFEQAPKYDYIRNLFKKVFFRFQFKLDYLFEWGSDKSIEVK